MTAPASESSTQSAAGDNPVITVLLPQEPPRLSPSAARSLLRLLRQAADRCGAAT
jgi:hypothetical protein